ncbi:unnamed protein product [Schistocephalus solidus]|uniref:ANK_REP_REGION domain-containing protein n=1 Tax=Schistocephalus solidus TaxID=70667 RepID=A0A3P7CJA7_SCHSO|nr:unnamed protein product [Schistocephalus solidus]
MPKLIECLKRLGGSPPALINKRFCDGQTSLIAACRSGQLEIVRYLVDTCGANIEQVGTVTFDNETVEGVPPLWCAAAANHLEVVKFLVSRGANVNQTTITNSTALRAACFDGHEEVVKFLVENGADVEIPNRHGHTCLMISCYRGHYNIALYLLSRGARVNRRSAKGSVKTAGCFNRPSNTALHDCAESGNLRGLQLLLEHSALMQKDEYGQSPIMSGANSGFKKIVNYLSGLRRSPSSDEAGRHGAEETSPGGTPSADSFVVPIEEQAASYELLGASLYDRQSMVQDAIEAWMNAMGLRQRYFGYSKRLPSTPKVPPRPFTSTDQETAADQQTTTESYSWCLIELAAREAVASVANESAVSPLEPSPSVGSESTAPTAALPAAIRSDAYFAAKYERIAEDLQTTFARLWAAEQHLPITTAVTSSMALAPAKERERERRRSAVSTRATWNPGCHGRQQCPSSPGDDALSAAADAILGIEPICWHPPLYRRQPLEHPVSNSAPGCEQDEEDREGPYGDVPMREEVPPATERGKPVPLASLNDPLIVRLRERSQDAFGAVREFADSNELHQVTQDQDALQLQPLLIRLRILGPDHPDTIYFIRFRGATYADRNNIRFCFSLWRYALELQRVFLEPLCHVSQSSFLSFAELFHIILCNSYIGLPAVGLDPTLIVDCIELSVDNIERGIEYSYYRWHERHPWSYTTADKEATNLLRHVSLCLQFIAMILHYYSPDLQLPPKRAWFRRQLRHLWSQCHEAGLTAGGDISDECGVTVLTSEHHSASSSAGPAVAVAAATGAGTSVVSNQSVVNDAETVEMRKAMTPDLVSRFLKQIRRLIRVDPRVHQGHTVLHIACCPESSKVGRYDLFPFPSVAVINFLCELGANADALDADGQRPIGLILSSRQITDEKKAEYISCLVEAGAHVDASNRNGVTLLHPASRPVLEKCNFRPLDHVTLQCLAAKAAVCAGLGRNADQQLAGHLCAFLAMH